jgi:parallel beta-helix repeat protein
MYNNDDSSPTVTNCTFTANSVKFNGGGMRNNKSNPTVTNCTFTSNSAGWSGGGMQNHDDSSPTVTNCTFSENTATKKGGGMYNVYNSSPTVTNCTFTSNSAGRSGGGMRNYRHSNSTVTNCILWSNTAPVGNEIYNSSYSTPIIGYCDIAGSGGSGSWDYNLGTDGGGNIDVDPLFLYASGGDLRLLPDSACIDAGDNTAVPAGVTTDLGGNPRFVDQPEVPDTGNGTAPIVDMGAYEPNYIEVAMKFTPQALNPGSQGNWVKAHFVLPEEFLPEYVDTNTPAVIAPFGIESDHINVFTNEDGLVEIEAAFSRSDFCSSATSDDVTEVIVIGLLNSGQNFYGTDTIRIIDKSLEYVAVLTAHWLEADCGKSDWCDGFDLDHNGVVNFVDFALTDGCCIEIIRE